MLKFSDLQIYEMKYEKVSLEYYITPSNLTYS